jgi:hypothetical protein
VTRRARGDGGLHWYEQRDPNGTGRITPEALRRVAEIARAHLKGQGARSDALVSDDAYRAIEDAVDVSPRTAQRWVKRAREAGLV